MVDSFNAMISQLAQDTIGSAQLDAQLKSAKDKKIDDAAKDFEAVFLAEMMGPIFQTVEVDPMFGGGQGEEVYRSMMVQEYAKSMADQGGIGLASEIKRQLLALQEQTGTIQ